MQKLKPKATVKLQQSDQKAAVEPKPKHCSDIQKFIGVDGATHKIQHGIQKGRSKNVANPESSTQFELTLPKNSLELRRLATKKT